MKLLLNAILLVGWLALQKCGEAYVSGYGDISESLPEDRRQEDIESEWVYLDWPISPDVLKPRIAVYQQMKDRGQVIVWCMFGMTERSDWGSVDLSVESEHNYTMEEFVCFRYGKVCQFEATVSPPVSFTCVHELYFNGDVKYLRSETYTYALDHRDGISSSYIGFSSFIVVGLIIMTAAVIVTTIRSNAKVNTGPTEKVIDNDYLDA